MPRLRLKLAEKFEMLQLALPSFIYGVMWSIATAAWFVSSQKLSQSVSFPLSTRLPGIIASLWGVLYFKEIRVSRVHFTCNNFRAQRTSSNCPSRSQWRWSE